MLAMALLKVSGYLWDGGLKAMYKLLSSAFGYWGFDQSHNLILCQEFNLGEKCFSNWLINEGRSLLLWAYLLIFVIFSSKHSGNLLLSSLREALNFWFLIYEISSLIQEGFTIGIFKCRALWSEMMSGNVWYDDNFWGSGDEYVKGMSVFVCMSRNMLLEGKMIPKYVENIQLHKIYNHAFKSTDIFGLFTCIWQASLQPSSFISEWVIIYCLIAIPHDSDSKV